DDAEELPLLLGRELALEQELDESAHAGERRPQLVGDGRDELVLEPVELLAVGDVAQVGGEARRVADVDRRDRDLDREAAAVAAQPLELEALAAGPLCAGPEAAPERLEVALAVVVRHEQVDHLLAE